MSGVFKGINENLLTGVNSRSMLGQVRSGQVRDYYRLKSQGRTALFLKYLKLNTQLMDNRRTLG